MRLWELFGDLEEKGLGAIANKLDTKNSQASSGVISRITSSQSSTVRTQAPRSNSLPEAQEINDLLSRGRVVYGSRTEKPKRST